MRPEFVLNALSRKYNALCWYSRPGYGYKYRDETPEDRAVVRWFVRVAAKSRCRVAVGVSPEKRVPRAIGCDESRKHALLYVSKPTTHQSTAGWLQVAIHELTHAIGFTEKLLSYATEEVIAESVSLLLLFRPGALSGAQLQQSLAYIRGWRKKSRLTDAALSRLIQRRLERVTKLLHSAPWPGDIQPMLGGLS